MIDLLIPVERDGAIDLDLLSFSRAGFRIHITRDQGKPRQGDYLDRIAEMRNALKERVRAPYWLSLDADTRLDVQTLQCALSFLAARPSWAGVGLWGEPGPIEPEIHVHAYCALHRTETLLPFRYGRRLDGFAACECAVLCYTLRGAGWIYRYHPTLRCQHGRH